MRPERPARVAIVGGGCAAMAAAFELTSAAHRGRFDVTVYQLGWRLGGKGASGRGPAGRIEEHGLHFWMGWYENAFRMMRHCYAELARDPARCPIATWRDAFVATGPMGFIDRSADGRWYPWLADLRLSEGGLPGDPYTGTVRWSMRDYFRQTARLVRVLFETIASPKPATTPQADAPPRSTDWIERFLRYGELATLAMLVEGVRMFELVAGELSSYSENVVLRFLDRLAENARRQIEARIAGDLELRRLWMIADLALATMRGMVRFGLLSDPRGFDAIDQYDIREWLRLNGASEASLDGGWLRALYDLGFAYEDGDPARPRFAAAPALRGMLRAFFTYRGSYFWAMQAGMGDVVFAPLYEVLKRRGARFAFFHRLERVRLADSEPPHVAALEFAVQADIEGGREYQPLVDVGGLPCWPAEPDWAQLVGGDRLRREGWEFESHWDGRLARRHVLRVEDDFDFVVLGVGLGAIPHVCADLVARDPRWRAMVHHVKTVATQAFQIWMHADLADLGWPGEPAAISGFVEPFDTWADMRHLIARERWTRLPRALEYFCNVLPDSPPPAGERPDHPARQREAVRQNAIRFLNHDVEALWPGAVRAPGEFRWELLADPAEPDGPVGPAAQERFASQYWTANVNPSDRYVQAVPGSSAYRISPLDQTYDNLTVAGDWTDCGFNAGCVEAAVMSGRLAAHAIAGSPALEDIIGFDHP